MNPRYFTPGKKDQTVQCGLCPRRCPIPPGETGRCRVRANRDGGGAIPFYGFVTALAEDPIEKKPLYHFRPGSSVLSVGFAGCNLHCPFCQNWRISQLTPENRPPGFGTPRKTGIPGGKFSPEKLIASVRSGGFTQVAYTYSEPLVHAEFLLDCMTLAREAGIANVLVSNGCLNREPAEAILALTDAANIDLKCFSEDTYSRVLGGDLSSVLAFIETAWKTGVRLEVTTLIVPGLNDGEEETGRCAAFLAGLSRDIPWHLSAYHPDYRWRTPPTEPSRLIEIARRVRETLPYVYTGNIGGEKGFSDTPCPRCGVPLVRRNGYRIDTSALVLRQTEAGLRYHCARCGNPTPIIST